MTERVYSCALRRRYSTVCVLQMEQSFYGNGKARLNGDTKREADSDEVKAMREENAELKEALAEQMLRNRF